MTKKVVVYYDKDNYIPCGSDYTLFMELKTIKGVQNRLDKGHNKRMLKRGMKYYRILSYVYWKNSEAYEGIKYQLEEL